MSMNRWDLELKFSDAMKHDIITIWTELCGRWILPDKVDDFINEQMDNSYVEMLKQILHMLDK